MQTYFRRVKNIKGLIAVQKKKNILRKITLKIQTLYFLLLIFTVVLQ